MLERSDKIQHSSLIKKKFNKIGIDACLLNILKYTSLRSRDSVLLNSGNTSMSEPWQGCPLLPLRFSIMLVVLANAVRQEKTIRSIRIKNNIMKILALPELIHDFNVIDLLARPNPFGVVQSQESELFPLPLLGSVRTGCNAFGL